MVYTGLLGDGRGMLALLHFSARFRLNAGQYARTLRLSTHAHGGDGPTAGLVAPIFFFVRGSFPARIRPANPDHSSKAYAGFI